MEDNMSFDAVETQIKEARERAEVFASSLHRAREQEELFEEERQKWLQTFEEKSIMIDQLERELTSTVDALNQEKQEKTVVQKQLVQSSWNAPNLSQPLEAVNQKIEAPLLPDNSDHSKHDDYPLPDDSNHSKHDYLERGASDRRVLELLQQSQEETTQARREISFMRAERDQLADQVSMTKRQLDRLTEDRDQLLILKKNGDNKLKFRNEQVAEYEIEKERNSRKETELTELIKSLEKQVKAQRDDLVSSSVQMRDSDSQRVSLEQRINDYSIKICEYSSSQSEVPNALLLQAKFDEMERRATELTDRAESAEISLKMLMDSGVRPEGSESILVEKQQQVLSKVGYLDSQDDDVDGVSDSQSDDKSDALENLADIIERQRHQIEQQDQQQQEVLNHPVTYNRSIIDLEEEEAALANQQYLKIQPQSEIPLKNEIKVKKSKSSATVSNKKIVSGEYMRGSMESGDSHLSKSSRKSSSGQNLSLGSITYNEPNQMSRKVNPTVSNQVKSNIKRPNSSIASNPPLLNGSKSKPLIGSSSAPSSRSRSLSQPRFNADNIPSQIKRNASTTAVRSVRPEVNLTGTSRGLAYQSTPSRRTDLKCTTIPHGHQVHNYTQLHTPKRTQIIPTDKVSITAKSLLKPSMLSSSKSGITTDPTGRKKLNVMIPYARPRKESPEEKDKMREGKQKGTQNLTATSDKNNFIHAVKTIVENFPEEFAKDNFGLRSFDDNPKYSTLGIADIRKIGALDMNILGDKKQTEAIADDGTFEEKLDSNYCGDSYKNEVTNDNVDIASSILSLNNSLMQDNDAKIVKKIKKKKVLKKGCAISNATSRTISSLNSLGKSTSFL